MPKQKAKLSSFEGQEVIGVALEVRNAAGGLNEAMKVDPAEYHIGDEITVVMRTKVTKVRHDPVKDTDSLRRVHILTADEATVIDDALVAEALDAQAERIEKAAGVRHLQIRSDLGAAHDRGEHGDPVEDCPLCEEEAAAAAEAAEA